MKFHPLCKACLLIAGLCFARHAQANPLSRWTWRHPEPQGLNLRAVTYGNGTYVAVGEAGTIVISTNGQEWVLVSAGEFPTLRGVAAAPNGFVAVGDLGAIVTSSNGLDWAIQPSGTNVALFAVAYNSQSALGFDSPFLAVGAGGINLISENGRDWAIRTNFTSSTLFTIAVKGRQFLAAGENNSAFLGNGFSWTRIYPSASGIPRVYNQTYFLSATADPSFWMLSGSCHDTAYSNYTFQSASGYGWSPTGDSDDFTAQLPWVVNGLAYGEAKFVAVGRTSALYEFWPGVIAISTNAGTSWTRDGIPTPENIPNAVCYGAGRFVVVGDYGSILVSTNGMDWSVAVPHRMSEMRAIASNSELCLAVGSVQSIIYPFVPNPSAFTTRDGVKWQAGFTDYWGLSIEDLAELNGTFAGVRGSMFNSPRSDVLITTNGADWLVITLANAPPPHGIVGANGKFILVGERGSIWVSTNGLVWADRSITSSNANEGFNAVAYGKGIYVAAGNAIALSTNGWDWSLQSAALPAAVRRMTFADGLFVATAFGTASASISIFTSTNGIEWTIRYQEPNPNNRGPVGNVAYGNGKFLAWCGSLVWSKDAVQWQLCDAPLVNVAMGGIYVRNVPVIGFFRNRFIVAGPYGRIFQSDDTSVPVLFPRRSQLGFDFDFRPLAGDEYRVQASPNLTDWETIHEGVGNGQTNTFTDSSAGVTPQRFFRVVTP